ncbi:MAG TPA: hypothetical protein ENN17_04085 [bacterium]|nr:hypothetical protein [bacterium]
MIIRNPYKRLDVFRCSQEAHARFDGRVSAYHVLKEKRCYPDGCLYFLWRCALMEKGRPCIHRYRYVGKNCKGCTYYLEEKIHIQPQNLLDPGAYESFLEEVEQFDDWLDRIRYRRMDIAGRIRIVKPWFEQTKQGGETHTRLRGYLLVVRNGFIGLDRFEDTFYVRVRERHMHESGFVPKMKIELEGEIREDRGRIVIHRPRKIEILKKGWGRPWSRDRALVAVRTATLLREQTDLCLGCPWGALADITEEEKDGETRRYRNLFCLKGIPQPDGCYVLGLMKKQKSASMPRGAERIIRT